MTSLLLIIIYLAFISLGLPDSLLGAAWPSIYPQFGVPVAWSGIVSLIISLGTVVSSLMSDRLNRRLGAGMVSFLSVAMTAAALFGFSTCSAFWMLCIWAVPYGLGAGSVDAALNNYIALHYASRHMSWLHCMWGVGASVGPFIMGRALTAGLGWNQGYRRVGMIQTILVVILLLSLPLWKKAAQAGKQSEGMTDTASDQGAAPNAAEPDKSEHPAAACRVEDKNISRSTVSEKQITSRSDLPAGSKVQAEEKQLPLKLNEIFGLPGAVPGMLCFFSYCAIEATTGLWASSYLVLTRGIDAATAARYASLFFLGITIGRAFSGFLTLGLNDEHMVSLGQALIAAGILMTLLPLGQVVTLTGLIVIGLGAAPIYPSLLHATPQHFGEANSQAVMGVQMACAYIGTSVMPPLFGALTKFIGIGTLPVVLLLLLTANISFHRALTRTARA